MTNFLMLALHILAQVLGDIWLSRGMKQFGAVGSLAPAAWLDLGLHLATNPWIWLAVPCLILSVFCYFGAISRLDLSYVISIQSFSFVLNALFAWWILGETIGVARWVSTLFITVGVSIVSLTQGDRPSSTASPPSSQHQPQSELVPLFIAPLGITLSKTWLAIMGLALSDSISDILVSRGLKQLPALQRLAVLPVLQWIGRILRHPVVIIGLGFQTLTFILFLCALSWADISFVRPATALTYVTSILGAYFILKENLRLQRSIGMAIILCGIIIHR